MPSSDSYIVLVEKIGMLDYFMLELYASGPNEIDRLTILNGGFISHQKLRLQENIGK